MRQEEVQERDSGRQLRRTCALCKQHSVLTAPKRWRIQRCCWLFREDQVQWSLLFLMRVQVYRMRIQRVLDQNKTATRGLQERVRHKVIHPSLPLKSIIHFLSPSTKHHINSDYMNLTVSNLSNELAKNNSVYISATLAKNPKSTVNVRISNRIFKCSFLTELDKSTIAMSKNIREYLATDVGKAVKVEPLTAEF